MDSFIELQRRTHEVIDCLEESIVESLVNEHKTHKARLLQEHYVSSLLDSIVTNSTRLQTLYADTALRQTELDHVTVIEDTGNFYEDLKNLKDRHRRLQTSIDDIVETEALKSSAYLSDEAFSGLFSGEEVFGRFLDLHEPYVQYVNLKDVKKVDYLRYIDEIDNFMAIPVPTKQLSAYQTYLSTLLENLSSFFKRSKPLFDIDAHLEQEMNGFEEKWTQGKIFGWKDLAKNERGDLYCRPCQKQFYNESVYKSHLTGKKHLKAASNNSSETVEQADCGKWAKGTAKLEAIISCYLSILSKIREETKGHVEAKQSRSAEERAADLEREEKLAAAGVKAEEEEQQLPDPKIYNPLNLPLDWDGKPIPYWLWKLHGLGTRYPCEICGSQVYMGRKAFDQHFYEWRHSHGLKCLGIPNTRHFFQVTSIKDAQDLWDKLKVQARQENFRPEVMEELEDQHGNVYSRKMYDDLKRQGLL